MKNYTMYQGHRFEITEQDIIDLNLKRTTIKLLALKRGVLPPAPVPPAPVEPLPVEPLPVEPLPVEPLPVEPIIATTARSRAKQAIPNNPFHSKYVHIETYVTLGLRMKIKDSSERLVYEHLCLAAWKTGGCLSNNPVYLRHVAGVDWRQDRFDSTFNKIRHLFDVSEDGTTLTVPDLPEEFQAVTSRKGRGNVPTTSN